MFEIVQGFSIDRSQRFPTIPQLLLIRLSQACKTRCVYHFVVTIEIIQSASKSVEIGIKTKNKGKMPKVYMKLRFLDNSKCLSSELWKLGESSADDQCVGIK